MQLKEYRPEEGLSYDSRHTLALTFMYDTLKAQVIVQMGGNVCGGEVINSYTDFSTGLNALKKHPLNIKHCVFEETEDDFANAEVEWIKFFHPTKGELTIPLDEANQCLIGIEIIKYEEECADESEDAEEDDNESENNSVS